MLFFALLLPTAASATALPSTITENTTLTAAGGPYTGTSTIESGVTLNAEPGVKFSGLSLKVKGTLSAEGTVSQPIIISESNGNYTPITFEPGSGSSVLNHVEMTKVGSEFYVKAPIQINQSSPTIENSTFTNVAFWTIWVPEGGSPEIANNHFSLGTSRSAIYYQASEGQTGNVNIHGNYVEGGKTDPAISVKAAKSSITATTLSGNTVVGNESSTSFTCEAPEIPGDITENTLSGNKSNQLLVSGTVAKSSTWKNGGTEVKLGAVTVPSEVTLKIEPGLNFKTPHFTVKGTLLAEGTTEAPITFTEGSGNYTPFLFEPGSGASVLNHVEISKSGSEFYVTAPIQINKSSPTIENSTFSGNGFWTIWVPEGGSPEIANNHFSLGTSRSAIYYQAGEGQTGNINIHGNYVEGGETDPAISVKASKSSITATTLSGNTVVGNESSTSFTCEAPEIPGDITENTLSGNKSNQLLVSGTVAKSSTWKNGGTRIKIGGVTVASGVTLTIEPGLYFTSPHFTVKGTLLAEGTTEAPIIFTEGSGNYTPFLFEPGSGTSVLNHVEMTKVGSEFYVKAPIQINKSSPTIENSTFAGDAFWTIWVPEGGSPEIANNHFSLGTSRSAIYYQAGEGQTGNVNIHGNYVEGGETDPAISVKASKSSITATTLSGNTVVGNESSTSFTCESPEIPGDVTENTLSGNKSNQLLVSGTVAKSSTWKNGGTEVKLGAVTVPSEVTLKIEPGLNFKTPHFTVKGTLLAEGTTEAPITFTEGSGNYTPFLFEPGSGASVLNRVHISNMGSEFYVKAPIQINKSSPTIENSVLVNSAFWAIWIPEGGSPVIANNVFLGIGRSAIYYQAGEGQTGNINIHGNYVEGGKTDPAISVKASKSSITATTLSGNTVVGNESSTSFTCESPEIPGDITENTLSGNKSNLIQVSGTVAKSSTWKNGKTRVKPSGVTVASGATLTIAKGVLMVNPSFTVKGTLSTEGTAAEPVVFTGLKEESAGEWGSVKFEAGSGSSVISNTEFAYGGKESAGMVEAKGSHPTITNSTFRKGTYGIKVTESGSPRIEWDRFRGNTSGGLSYSGTGELSAPNNDWGCANGPKPAGCGDSVTKVAWKPTVQLPELAGHCRGKESQCGEGADPVSLATGALNYSHRDLLLTNKSSEPLEFTRAYYSGSSADSGLGPGWSQTGLASAIELQSGKEVLVLRQDGRQDIFENTESGYKAPSGVTDTLAKVEGTFQLTTLEGTVYRFDSSGRIASITDSHGLKTTYTYSSEGRLTTITDPSSQTLTFSYNSSNHITLVKDSTGREVKFGYSAAGDLETVTDALGGVTKYAYDAQHRLTSITDPRSNVILKNTYNGEGKITEQEDGLGHLWKLEYKPSETIVTEPEGGKRKYGFDAQDRVISETDQLGHTTTTSYDEAGNVHEVIQPGGAKWVYGHDAAGNLTSVEDPEGDETTYEYNAQNRPTLFTDARGNAWAYEWSKAGDLEKISDPEGGETTLTYNESDQPLTRTDPDKHKTEFSYDTRGNELSETDPLGHKTSYEYSTRNYLIAQTAPGLKAEKFERDAYGDLLARTTPEGHVTKYEYDKNGLPIKVTDPGEDVWKIERNAMERPTAYTDPAEQQATVSYNGDLKPTKVVNRRGKETTYGYNLANELTEVDRPEGEDWTYGYDSRGNRTSVVNPREHETSYEFDLLNRMTKASEPLGVTTEYGYDANGDLTSVKDPRGNTTSYGYDKLGRLTEVTQPLEKTTTYTYDAAGNRLTKATAVGTLEFGYNADNLLTEAKAGESPLRLLGYNADNLLSSATDAKGRKIEVGYNEDSLVNSIKDGRGQSIARTYDSRGELTKQEDGRGSIAYEYDKFGRLTSLTDPQGKTLGFGYDSEGDLTEVTRPNGVTTTNVYNEAGRLAETTAVEAGESPVTLESLKYGYDAAGNVTSKIDQRLEAETTYSYDALNRLTEFNPPGEGPTTSYGYDKAGNRTEAGGVTYTYNALNQLTEASDGTTYGYDGAGRLVSKESEAGKTSYEWDLLGHLAKAEGLSETVNYAYDGLERLSERAGSGGTQVIHYGDLSDLPTYVANGEGKTTTSYVQGAHGLIEQRSGEATDYPLADTHGDITAITGPTGEVESRQEYGPWGEQLSGPSLEMGFLGAWERPSDPATGLIQMGARSYSPERGSLMSEDPVAGHMGVGASVDRYLYVWDNPLNRLDLNGRDVCVLGACAEEAAEDVGGAAESAFNTGTELGGEAGSAAGSLAEGGWNLTAPGRHWIRDRAEDFVKIAKTHTAGWCVGGAVGAGVGVNAQFCVVGNWNGIGITATGGAGVSTPNAEITTGPVGSNAHSACELGGPFVGGSVGGGEGVVGGASGSTGTAKGNRVIHVFHPWVGAGVGSPVSGNAGISDTYAPCVSW